MDSFESSRIRWLENSLFCGVPPFLVARTPSGSPFPCSLEVRLQSIHLTHSYDALRDVAGATNTTGFVIGYAVLETVFHLESGNARTAARVSDAM